MRELVCVRKPKKVERWQELSSGPCITLGRSEFQKKRRYKEVDKDLEAWIDPRVFGIPCILLKFCYCASKRDCFTFSQRGTRIQDRDENLKIFEENKQAKKKMFIKIKFS